MEKKELFRIMAAADGSMLRELAQPLAEKYGVSVVKAPAKTLAMIKLREPVKNSLFYLGVKKCLFLILRESMYI